MPIRTDRHTAARKSVLGVVIPLAFFALVGWLLQDKLRVLDVAEILAALRSIAPWTIAAAVCFTVAAYAALVCFDILARVYVGHGLTLRTTAAISFVSYAFNLNFGAMLGAFGFRARLYSRHGLRAEDIARIALFAVAGNWIGWLLLLGVSVALHPDTYARLFHASPGLVRTVAVVLAVAPAAYPVLCGMRIGKIRIGSWTYALPTPALACVQIATGCAYWIWPAAIIFVLQPQAERIPYAVVLSTSLMAAVAGVIMHVPAGLGVIEVVFVKLCGHLADATDLIATLLAFRAVFLLMPLPLAIVVLAILEWRAPGRKAA